MIPFIVSWSMVKGPNHKEEMWRRIQEVHPTLAEVGKFIDWKSYRLGRLQSEMWTEFKREGMGEVDRKSKLKI